MVGTLSNDCFNITLAQSFVILNYFNGNYNDTICDYILEVDYNCCGKKSYPLRVLHDFESSITGCGTETINAVNYGYFDFLMTSSLDTDCVETFRYQIYSNNITLTPVAFPTAFTFRFYFPIATTNSPATVEFTTVNGLK
jgi:hypothetical protein